MIPTKICDYCVWRLNIVAIHESDVHLHGVFNSLSIDILKSILMVNILYCGLCLNRHSGHWKINLVYLFSHSHYFLFDKKLCYQESELTCFWDIVWLGLCWCSKIIWKLNYNQPNIRNKITFLELNIIILRLLILVWEYNNLGLSFYTIIKMETWKLTKYWTYLS